MQHDVSERDSSDGDAESVSGDQLSTDGGRRDPSRRNDGQQHGQQPQQGQSPPRGQGPNAGRPPSQQNGGTDGFSRRQLLLGGGGVAVVGWLLFFRSDSDSDDNPNGDSSADATKSATRVVEAYYGRVQNRNFAGAKELIHPDTSTPTDQKLEQLADTLDDVASIEAETSNGPTPDADRSRYDTVQTFEAVSVTLEKEGEGSHYVSGTVAHHTDGRWLVWF